MVVGSSLFLFSRFNIHCSNLILTLLTSIHPIFSSGTFLSCPRYFHPVPFFHLAPFFHSPCYSNPVPFFHPVPFFNPVPSFNAPLFPSVSHLPFDTFLSFPRYSHPVPFFHSFFFTFFTLNSVLRLVYNFNIFIL